MNKLLQKYNIPVPRYTSYPPANFFTEAFTAEEYEQAIRESNNWKPDNISFYFHVPFCKQLCYFCGCNSYAMRKSESVDAYMKAMLRELEMVTERLDKTRLVSQIHYGGGTPNAVEPKYLKQLNDLIAQNFKFIDEPEIAIECNPAYLSEKQIEELKEAGFNRFSLGVQDYDKEVLETVNREEPFMPLEKIVALIKKGDKKIKVNLDFIYGLPKQTAESFAESIKKAVTVKPDRLVTFSYAHVPWVSKIQKKLEPYGLPENDEKVKMNQTALEILTSNGYKVIGMDHYALDDDELSIARKNHELHRNFQGYCTRRTTGQVYAIGVTGISQLDRVYTQNTKSINQYIELINKGEFTTIKGYKLSHKQTIIRETITQLMCNHRIKWNDLSKKTGLSLDEIKAALANRPEKLAELEEDGIITTTEDSLQVTEEGSLFIRNVAAAFDPLTGTKGKNFSKPV
jgi:oxygen-independent coproporphyrinogen-3 oxidase